VIAGLLLAAGVARRFGGSKLTTSLRGEPLVRHSARSLAEAKCIDAVWVVLGNDATSVRHALAGLDVRFVEHDRYLDGLGTSIAAGVEMLPEDCDAVVIALGDQPLVPSSAFDALVSEWKRTFAHVVATRYRGVVANPVLFARATFPELCTLSGDSGARSVVMANPARVRWLDVDAPVPIDIDTPDDLSRL
jgi:molybdenum cofactor cytidylyltransferase